MKGRSLKIVVLGGYGNFGARFCRALADDPAIELVVCGRDAAQAAAFAQQLGGRASALALDITHADLAQTLRRTGAGLVVHTAGPFQAQAYQVALAAAAAGCHYIDLADGRRFVCDFPAATDAAFRHAGCLGVTGASTVPALSSAVIDHLTQGWQRIDTIHMCIAPAQTAPRGVATMAAVLSYCGAPIQVWQAGAWVTHHGWAAPQAVAFARLRPRAGALCDIPDLELFPQRYPGVTDVMFRAALEVGLGQTAFAWLAALRRKGVIAHPERWARVMNFMGNLCNVLGSRLGGMVVRVSGLDAAAQPVRRAWHIAADDDHGPEIPCMAAILLARRLVGGDLTQTGACTAAGLLPLAAFSGEFAKWGMVTDIIDESNEHDA
jgi:NAD(P)-dependent dehydrogenase (short-subunit alcohol dehydrogenase family)